jgi:hypothetical protein
MMAAEFFGKWKEIITETAKDVTKKTGEVVEVVADKTGQTLEVQKLKNQVRIMQRNNERDYKHIGKMVFHKFQNDEEMDDSYTELCETIAERLEKIEELKKQIAKLKGLDTCPECGASVENHAKYCSNCGAEVEE